MIELTPTISVLLPVCNAERFLRQAVESVLGQTFGDFELLALDDGSTDRSLDILHEYAAKDNRMRVLWRENRGHVATLNELIVTARGRYFARMDADDICRPQRFEKQIAVLEAHPEYVAIGSRVLLIDPEGMPICDFVNELSHEEIDSANLSGGGGSRMCHPSVIMRREAVLKVGQYRAEYGPAEDIDLFLRLAEEGRVANLPEILLEYRQHYHSIAYTQLEKQRSAAQKAVVAAWVRRGIANTTDETTQRAGAAQTRTEAHRKWAWWPLSAGHVATARKHALKAFTKNPFSIDNARVLACAIRGR